MTYFEANKKLLLAAAAAAVLAACGQKEPPAEAAPAPADGKPVTAVVSAEKPGASPSGYVKKDTYFSVPALAGGSLDLAEHAGKPVMFMLFTENCPYCRKAAPALEKLHKAYSGKGLGVLGLCIEGDPRAAKDFAQDLGVTFPMGYGARAVYKQYRAQGVPFIFLLDRGHKVVSVWPGYTESFYEQMTRAVEKALASA